MKTITDLTEHIKEAQKLEYAIKTFQNFLDTYYSSISAAYLSCSDAGGHEAQLSFTSFSYSNRQQLIKIVENELEALHAQLELL